MQDLDAILQLIETNFSSINTLQKINPRAVQAVSFFITAYETLIYEDKEFLVATKKSISKLNLIDRYAALYPYFDTDFLEKISASLADNAELIVDTHDSVTTQSKKLIEKLRNYAVRLSAVDKIVKYVPNIIKSLRRAGVEAVDDECPQAVQLESIEHLDTTISDGQHDMEFNHALAQRLAYFFAVYVTQDFKPRYYALHLSQALTPRYCTELAENFFDASNCSFLYVIDALQDVYFIQPSGGYEKLPVDKSQVECVCHFLKLAPQKYFILQGVELEQLRQLIGHTYVAPTFARGFLTHVLKCIYDEAEKGLFFQPNIAFVAAKYPPDTNIFTDENALFLQQISSITHAYIMAAKELYYLDIKKNWISIPIKLHDATIDQLKAEQLIVNGQDNAEEKYRLLKTNINQKQRKIINKAVMSQHTPWLSSSILKYYENDLVVPVLLSAENQAYYQHMLFASLAKGGDPTLFALIFIHNTKPQAREQIFSPTQDNDLLLKNYLFYKLKERTKTHGENQLVDAEQFEIDKTIVCQQVFNELCAIDPWQTADEKKNLKSSLLIKLANIKIVNLNSDNKNLTENVTAPHQLAQDYMRFKNILAMLAKEQQTYHQMHLQRVYKNKLEEIIYFDKLQVAPYHNDCDLILTNFKTNSIKSNLPPQKKWHDLTLLNLPGHAPYAYIFTGENAILYVYRKSAYQAELIKEWINPPGIAKLKTYFNIKENFEYAHFYGDRFLATGFRQSPWLLCCHKHKLSQPDLLEINAALGHFHHRSDFADQEPAKNLLLNPSLIPEENLSNHSSSAEQSGPAVDTFFMPPVALAENYKFSPAFVRRIAGVQLRAEMFIKDGNTLLHELAKNYQDELAKTDANIILKMSPYIASAVILRLSGLRWDTRNQAGQTVCDYANLHPDDRFIQDVEADVARGMSYIALRLRNFVAEYLTVLEVRQQESNSFFYGMLYKMFRNFGSYLPEHQQQRFVELQKSYAILSGTEILFNHQQFLQALDELLANSQNFPKGLFNRSEFLNSLAIIQSDMRYAIERGNHVYYHNPVHNSAENLLRDKTTPKTTCAPDCASHVIKILPQ